MLDSLETKQQWLNMFNIIFFIIHELLFLSGTFDI